MKKRLCLLATTLAILMFPALSKAQVTFVNPLPLQVDTACQNGSPISLDGLLEINDPSTTAIDTFSSVLPLPLFGTLSGLPTTVPANGGDTAPSGVTYTPIDTFGLDAVSIQVSNGSNMATTTIALFVSPAPAITIVTPATVDSGAATASLSYTGTSGLPVAYSITWDPPAADSGFSNVTASLLTPGSIAISLPSGLRPGTYTGQLTVQSAFGCTSIVYPFAVTVAGLPIVTTTGATGITPYLAALSGIVNDNGAATSVIFEYGTSPTLAAAYSVTGSPASVAAGDPATSIAASASGLRANTTYYFRVDGTNAVGTSYGAIDSFVTGDNAPSFTGGAFSVCENSDSLNISTYLGVNDADTGQTETYTVLHNAVNGHVTPITDTVTSTGGTVYPASFYYTPDTGFTGTDSFTMQVSDGVDTAAMTFYVTVDSLPNINIDSIPTVAYGATMADLYYTATGSPIKYTITWDGAATSAGFTTASDSTLPAAGPIVINIPVTATATSYSGSIQVVNNNNCESSNIPFSFNIATHPTVVTDSATSITARSATLNGNVNDNDGATMLSFNYGTTRATITSVSATPNMLAAGTGATADSATLSGLAPGTKYYFEAYAVNAAGADSGFVDSFTTLYTARFDSSLNPTGSNTLADCQNTGVSIDAQLAVLDSSVGVPLTWRMYLYPTHGSLGATLPATGISNGGIVTPSGAMYTPTIGYTGTDSFVVQIYDNAGDTAYTTVHVTVYPFTSLSLGTSSVVASHGAATASLPYTVTGSPVSYNITYGSGGFTNVSDATLSASPFTLNIPSGEGAGTYSGTVTVTNAGGCTSSEAFTITIEDHPFLDSDYVTRITNHSATLNAAINDSGTTTDVYFQYSTNSSFTSAPVYTLSAVSGSGTQVDTMNIAGLTPNTTYYFRSILANGSVSDTAAPAISFTTLDTATFAIGNNSFKTASVCEDGSLNIDTFAKVTDPSAGDTLTWTFRHTADASLSATTFSVVTTAGTTSYNPSLSAVTYTPSTGFSGADSVLVTVKDNSGDSAHTTIRITVNALPAITVTSSPTIAHGATTASLPYTSTGSPATYRISYAFGGFTNVSNATLGASPITLSVPSGEAAGSYTGSVTVTNSNGCTSAEEAFSITIEDHPHLDSDYVTHVRDHSATLNAAINDSGTTTDVYFQYSTNSSFTGAVVYTLSAVSGSGTQVDTMNIAGLTPNTTYYFRSILTNGGASDTASYVSFTTLDTATFAIGNNSFRTASVCENSSFDIDTFVRVNDPSAGDTLTWTFRNTSDGSLSATTYSVVTTAGTTSYAPLSGITYTPSSGFAGTDSVLVTVKDNSGDSTHTTIRITVDTLPAISLTTPVSAAHGAATASLPYSVTSGTPTHYSITYGSGSFTNVSDAALSADSILLNIPAGVGDGTYTGTVTVTNASGCTSTTGEVFSLIVNDRALIVNDSATSIYPTGVTLNATVNDSGTDVTVYFQYSTDTTYFAGSTAGVPAIDTTTGISRDSLVVTGLMPNTTYYFRAYAVTAAGTDTAIGFMPVHTAAQPAFAGGTSQVDTVCENTSINLNKLLTVIDSTAGQEIVWTYTVSHGTVTGLPDSVVSVDDTNYVPDSVVYTPNAGFSGFDTVTVTIADGTDVYNTTIRIMIDTTATVTASALSEPVCSGDTSTEISFSGPVTWTNNNISNGLGASGNDSIYSFLATNSGSVADSSVITVTPTGTCAVPLMVTVYVNPTPNVNPVPDVTNCDSSTTMTITFAGSTVSNTSYNWSELSPIAINLPDTTGVDSIPAFYAVNPTSFDERGVFIVTPEAAGCSGTTDTFHISILAMPGVSNPGPVAVCNGSSDTVTVIPTTGASDTWSASNGLITPTSGIGTPITFTASDTTSSVLYDTVTIIPSNGTCTGPAQSFVVSIHPRPAISNGIVPDPTCNRDSIRYTPMPVSGTFDSVMWTLYTNPGITTVETTGTDSIAQSLTNTTSNAVNVAYVFTVYATGCSTVDTERLTIEPTPVLSNTVYDSSICSGATFLDTLSTLTPNVTMYWSRAAVSGVTQSASSDTGIYINEVLTDSTTNPVVVVYTDSININGTQCYNIDTFSVRINPIPSFTNSFASQSVCSGQTFTFTPTSSDTSSLVTFTWTRPYVIGITDSGASGTGSIDEKLTNGSPNNLDVTYYYTASANGCANDSAHTLTVEVHPSPVLSSPTDTVVRCSGQSFTYIPASVTNGVIFSYYEVPVSGISSTDSTGSDILNTVLTNSNSSPATAVYEYVITVDSSSCSDTQSIAVSVEPSFLAPVITTFGPNTYCGPTFYQNFGDSIAVPAGDTLIWSATNATVYATGSTGQYALINFDQANTTAVVSLSYGNGICSSSASYTVTVGGAAVDTPSVVLTDGAYVCLDNTVASYQWGYDNLSTLDSTIMPGYNGQALLASGLDTVDNDYWVITVNNSGCIQKSYAHPPARGVHRNIVNGGAVAQPANNTEVLVYPNPATEEVNVNVITTIAGDMQVKIINLLGQQIYTGAVVNDKAKINVAGLPTGTYLISCYRDGVQISTARFIKN